MDLTLTDLACRRGGRLVFNGLDHHIAAGGVTVVRGPNGAGKSTLLRLLAGLIPCETGDARLGELSLTDDLAGFQERIAYAGHLDAVKPALTVRENLGYWAALFGGASEGLDMALERFGLARIAERPVLECSAGQKRRLGLARLMVMDRALWLLDEPTVALDSGASALVAELVTEHCAAGGIAMIATHIDLGLPEASLLEMQGIVVPARDSTSQDAFIDGEWG